jgi:hypothetical protein
MIYLKKFNEGIENVEETSNSNPPQTYYREDLDRISRAAVGHIHLNEGDNVLVLTQDELNMISKSLNFLMDEGALSQAVQRNKRLSSEEAKSILTKISLSKTTTDQCKNMIADLESMNRSLTNIGQKNIDRLFKK